MKRTLVLATAILALVAAPLAASDNDDKDRDDVVRTHLVGYNETPATINSAASGEFRATISEDGTAIHYELTFRDLSSGVLQSHIHFGRPATTGGIVLYLCTNLTPPVGPPTPQACPTTNPATITGTLTAADVNPIAATGQAIDPGAAGFAEMLKAIRAGAAYVNVHTTNHPSGEIRGRLGPHHDRDDHHDGDGDHHH
jgi:hypothetical protein